MAEKIEAILAGAMQEFLAHGYAATSMDQIAAVAGVSKATVYRHFRDKEGLFTALIQQLAQGKSLFTSRYLRDAQGEPRAVLRAWMTTMLDNISHDPQLFAFVRLVIGESGRFPALARAFVRHIEQPAIESLTHYLRSHPDLPIADAEVTARMIIGTLVHTMILEELLQARDLLPIERDRLIEGVLTMIMGRGAGELRGIL